MICIGLCMNVVGIVVVVLFLYSVGSTIFDTSRDMPDWVSSAWSNH